MAPIQYIDGNGVFLGSYQEGTPCQFPGAVEAPADESGFHGAEGMRWDGKAWVDYIPPPDSCTALQGRKALGMVRVQQISSLIDHLDLLMPELSDEERWLIKTAWEYGSSWDRLGREVNLLRDIYGMTEQERDDLMRLAVTL